MEVFTARWYEEQTYKALFLPSHTFQRIDFEGCTFIACSFPESAFLSCAFRDCTFKNCDLSLVKVDGSTFRNTHFEDCKLIGVNWAKAAWDRKGSHQLAHPVDFYRCVLNYSSFNGMALSKMTLQHCTAREVDFSEADLGQADCRFSDFSGSQFCNTDLSGADFRGANNYEIVPALNKLKKAKFSLPEALSLLYNLEIEISETAEGG